MHKENKEFKQKMLNKLTDSDERLAFSKVLDQVFLTQKNHIVTFSGFLDTRKQVLFYNIIKDNFDINIRLFGGLENTERKKFGFYLDYLNLEDQDFPISAVEINFNSKFCKVNHREILGAILGLGIDRIKMGDIIIFNERAIIFIDSDIADFICFNLKKVSNIKTNANIISTDNIFIPLEEFIEKSINVTSLRLDNIISKSFNLSRSKAVDLIKGKKVFINWKSISNINYNVNIQDVITLRGFGRITIQNIQSLKLDKFIVNLKKTL